MGKESFAVANVLVGTRGLTEHGPEKALLLFTEENKPRDLRDFQVTRVTLAIAFFQSCGFCFLF